MKPDNFVYFIATKDRSMVKIGISTNPRKRLASIQSHSPLAVELLASVPGTIEDERGLHTKFLEHHSHGEWFRGHEDVLSSITEISSAGGVSPQFRCDAKPLFKRHPSAGKPRPIEHARAAAEGLRRARLRERERFEAACRLATVHPQARAS